MEIKYRNGTESCTPKAVDADVLQGLLVSRESLQKQQKMLKEFKKEVDDTVQAVFDGWNIQSIKDERLGSLSEVTQTRPSLDKEKLKKELVRNGVPVDVVTDCFSKATTETTSKSYRYVQSKKTNP